MWTHVKDAVQALTAMHDLCALRYCFHVSLSMFSEVLKERQHEATSRVTKAKLEHHLQSLLASSCCFGLKEQAHDGGLSGGIGIPRKGVVYSSARIILDLFGFAQSCEWQ